MLDKEALLNGYRKALKDQEKTLKVSGRDGSQKMEFQPIPVQNDRSVGLPLVQNDVGSVNAQLNTELDEQADSFMDRL